MKLCTKCQVEKLLSEFGKASGNKDGLKSWCNSCCAESQRRRREILKLAEKLAVITKLCPSCKKEKDSSEFSKNITTRDGLSDRCKSCSAKSTRAWNAQRKSRDIDYSGDGSKVCNLCETEKSLKEFNKNRQKKDGYQNNCKTCDRALRLIREYRIGLNDYKLLFDAQLGCCLLCGVSDVLLHVDHDHETGRIRGLLCHKCNTALGLFKDNTEVMNRAIDYLLYHRGLPAVNVVTKMQDAGKLLQQAKEEFEKVD